jgi:hypothetical protein
VSLDLFVEKYKEIQKNFLASDEEAMKQPAEGLSSVLDNRILPEFHTLKARCRAGTLRYPTDTGYVRLCMHACVLASVPAVRVKQLWVPL